MSTTRPLGWIRVENACSVWSARTTGRISGQVNTTSPTWTVFEIGLGKINKKKKINLKSRFKSYTESCT